MVGRSMASITDIKRRILELAPAQFQEFCDTLISKQSYGLLHGYGMKAGTGNTTIGNPDTYFRKENGKYLFVAYTIQQASIYSKLKEDIDKCLDSSKTGLDVNEIEDIICCHTSSNLSAGDDKKLHDYCESKGVVLTIWGIDELANQVHNRYRSMAKDYLGLSIDTNQILSLEDFVSMYDANGMAAPLNTTFQFREKEKGEIENAIEDNPIVIISGKAGVGKTRLALEVAEEVATKSGYKLLCVKNNNLGLYYDLVAATEAPGKYLFFIDDANELSELSHILEYTTKENLGYIVKVIVTVRDYAKAKVVSAVKEYAIPKMIEIPSFSDDEIKGFLCDNLGIRNEDYAKQIVRIAEGNPRIGYMAGKLAVERQNLSAIKDVSQLYDAYYAKYVNGAIGDDNELCFTAGILSVVNAVVLGNMSVLNELLDDYGITVEKFKSKIRQLASLEVVEIQLDQVATFSDQCLANYMLYYVFFEKKILPFSNVLETGYKHFRNGVIRTINTILNIFESDDTKAYCEQEILKVWDNLQSNRDNVFEDFVKDFHVFRPEEAFLIAKQKIDAIIPEEFSIEKIDFSKNVFCYHDSVLSYLVGYQYSEYYEYVIELLLEYSSKTADTLISGYKWLENSYGMDVHAYRYKYYGQKKISDILYQEILKGNAIAMAIGFNWAKYSLGFSFHPTEVGRGNQFVFYNMEIKQSEGLSEYRKVCWHILISLAATDEWKAKVLLYLEAYARHLRGDLDCDIVTNDIKYVDQLLVALKCGRICYLKTVQRLLCNCERMNVEFDDDWTEILSGTEWYLYKLVENDFVSSDLEYEEYKSKRESSIIEYGKSISKADIPILVNSMSNIMSDMSVSRDSYSINSGFELILQQFGNDEMKAFLHEFVQHGKNLSIRPGIVIESLNRSEDSKKLLAFIKQSDFPQKNEWLFSFFETLQEEQVDCEMLQELLDFLHSDSDKNIISSTYRRMRFLDKFLSIETNIYPIASAIIYEKHHYSPFIVRIYFELLFHDGIYSPEELIWLFQSDLELLQEIYFFMLREGNIDDLKGAFLVEFLKLDESWIRKYSEAFWENTAKHKDFGCHRNSALWKTESYEKYFDYIFYHFPEEDIYAWRIGHAFTDVLTNVETDKVIDQHQRDWLEHIIIDNVTSDNIVLVFEFVCELGEDVRRFSTKVFLEHNQDYEMFSKISLVPNHWSGSGSLVPAYQKQVDYLQSLYPLIPGVEFLKHKALIKSKVEMLQEMIKREEVEEVCRNLYM